jgi:hypothetical protein
MDLKVLFGTGLCFFDFPKKASVNVGWVRVETHSNDLALGYTVLGLSDGPFVFGADIAERLIIADLRERPRF